MRRLLLVLLSLVLALGVSSCSKSSSTTAQSAGAATSTGATASGTGSAAAAGACPSSASGFAKTKFLAHAGLAFGAFHRYIYKPMRAGTFKSGASGRIRAFLKAAAAALFVKREVRLAYEAAQKSPALCKTVVAPMKKVEALVQGAVSKLKGGDLSGVNAVQSAVSLVESKSGTQGDSIKEQDTSI